jgi:hypothetical protein
MAGTTKTVDTGFRTCESIGMQATCQMSNGCCAMCNAVVKMTRPPTDPMTKLIPEKDLATRSVSYRLIFATALHIAQQPFDV